MPQSTPIVWTPREETSQTPSSGVTPRFSESALSPNCQVSAGATRSPKNDSRVRLNTHKVRLIVVAPENCVSPPTRRLSNIRSFALVAPLPGFRAVQRRGAPGGYFTALRRRWTKYTKPMTNRMPATRRITVVVSMIFSPFFRVQTAPRRINSNISQTPPT